MRAASLYVLALPVALALACSASATVAPGVGGGEVSPPGPGRFDVDAASPGARIDCIEPIADLCGDAEPCGSQWAPRLNWATAQLGQAWASASVDGCARVATQPCAGFFIAEAGGYAMPDETKYFFDAGTGALVAVVTITDPTSSSCQAGPAGFTDPLVLDCQPPTTRVCAADAGPPVDVDAATDSAPDDAAPDAPQDASGD